MKVFLSYSSKDDALSNQLDDTLMKYGANIFRDKRELEPLQNITTFMQTISRMDYAIMLISPNYLKSKPCLFEFTEYLKKQDAEKTIVPILTEGFAFTNDLRNEVLSHIYAETAKKQGKTAWFNKVFAGSGDRGKDAEDWQARFLTTWDFLVATKLFNFKQSAAKGFSDILAFLQVYEEEIQQALNKIVNIQVEEDMDIAFHHLMEQHPRSYWIIRYRAYLCARQKKYKKAIVYYEEFMSKFWDTEELITTFYDIGVCYCELKNYEAAIKAHKQAIAIEPFAYLSYRGLGDVYMEQKKLDLAYDHYLYSTQFQKHPLVLINLGAIERERGHYMKALSFFNEAFQLNEADALPLLNIAATYQVQKNVRACEDTITRAYTTFPNDYRVLTAYAAQNSDLKGNFPVEDLIEILKKSFEINPDFVETRMRLGQMLFLSHYKNVQAEELQLARKLLVTSLNMNPTKVQEKFIVSFLKLLYRLVRDDFSLAALEKQYPSA